LPQPSLTLLAGEIKLLPVSELADGLRQLCQPIASEVKLLQVGELADLNRKFRDSFV
jgi:hypothetical protein